MILSRVRSAMLGIVFTASWLVLHAHLQPSPLENLGSSGCTASGQCGQCQGDCDSDDDCLDGLRCFQRSKSSEVVPGCDAGGSGDIPEYDYCYKIPAGTLQNLGRSGCTADSKCGQCQGDCDSDADCVDSLRCFQRSNSSQIVPGCNAGGSGDIPTTDYCYKEPGGILQNLGPSGCTAGSKCGQCQGDCDSDADCLDSLLCFQRSKSSEIVPGCDAGGNGDIPTYDYCYKDPARILQNLGLDGCTAGDKCGQCKGDCDSDDDCLDGLRCFQRSKSTQLVPGCDAGGPGDVPATDYCYKVPTGILQNLGSSGCTAGSKCGQCQGDCDSDADCLDSLRCFQRSKSSEVVPGCDVGGSGDGPRTDYCYEVTASTLQDCGSKCGQCQGNCESDYDCLDGLQCFQRSKSSQVVPGCDVGGSGDIPSRNYCYKVPAGILQNFGESGCTAGSKCGLCQGDCDSDDDCLDGFQCYQRRFESSQVVPGCVVGGHGDLPTTDYCYKVTASTLKLLGKTGCTAANQCGQCQGNCDGDDVCIDGLKCFQRSKSEGVPGCDVGGSGDKAGTNYCYEVKATTLRNLGISGCTASSKCEQCQGDCDSDYDCLDDLKCFQRSKSSQVVPGCDAGGSGDIPTHDYCYKVITTTTTTTTSITTSPPFWATWVKGPAGVDCVTVCAEKGCLENQWPSSERAFKDILAGTGDKTCTSLDSGTWAVNPGQYIDYDNACYWEVADLAVQRCARSKAGTARYCPCAAKPSTITMTTSTTRTAVPTTTPEATTPAPPPGRSGPAPSPIVRRRAPARRRRLKTRRRRGKGAGGGSTARRRSRRRRRRRRTATAA